MKKKKYSYNCVFVEFVRDLFHWQFFLTIQVFGCITVTVFITYVSHFLNCLTDGKSSWPRETRTCCIIALPIFLLTPDLYKLSPGGAWIVHSVRAIVTRKRTGRQQSVRVAVALQHYELPDVHTASRTLI